MIKNWWIIFVRNIRKNPLYPIINVLGLTAGNTCFLLAMLYVGNEFSYEKWNPNHEKIYKAGIAISDGQIHYGIPRPLAEVTVNSFEEITEFMTYKDDGEQLISFGEKSLFSQKSNVSKKFFEFFPFPFKYGSPKSVLEDPSHLYISSELSTKLFGNINPVGKEVKLNNEHPFIIKGVYQLKGNNTHIDYFEMVSLLKDNYEASDGWGNFNCNTYYKVPQKFDNKKMSKKLSDFYFENAAKETNTPIEEVKKYFSMEMFLENISDMHLFSKAQRGAGANNIFILSLLSLLILVMSAINFINLSISGATTRAKEVAVRKTLGSDKKSIVFQFVSEVLVLCFVSFIFSLALVELLLPSFSNLLDVDLHILDVLSDLPILLITLTLLLLFAGLFPAIYLSNFNPVKVLKGNFSRSKSGTILKKSLITLQIFICSIFLIGAYVIYSQLKYMNEKDLGFNKEQVMMIEVSDREAVALKTDLFKKELNKINGVQKVFMSNRPPGTMAGYGSMTQVGYLENLVPTDIHFVDVDFFPTMEIKFLEGQNFLPNEQFDTIGINKIIVNQKLVKEFNLENPLGTKVNFFDVEAEIIGVVEDYITRGFSANIQPALYAVDHEVAAVMVKLDTENISTTIGAVEKVWTSQIEPDYPLQYEFLDENFARLFEQHHKLQSLVTALSIIMIFIALLGLFAVATHSIKQRYKEVAIRKTIGASEFQILGNLIKDFVIISSIGIIISLPIAYMLCRRWLEDFMYRIDMPYLPYFVVPLVILILTILIIGVQARKAIKVDLVTHLKFE